MKKEKCMHMWKHRSLAPLGPLPKRGEGEGKGMTGRPRAICGQRYPLPCFEWLWIGVRGSRAAPHCLEWFYLAKKGNIFLIEYNHWTMSTQVFLMSSSSFNLLWAHLAWMIWSQCAEIVYIPMGEKKNFIAAFCHGNFYITVWRIE